MNLDLLNNIKEVETPPYLLNKIELKLNQQSAANIKPYTWVLGSAFVLVVLMNIYLISRQRTQMPPIESYAQSMNLISNNNIYQ